VLIENETKIENRKQRVGNTL